MAFTAPVLRRVEAERYDKVVDGTVVVAHHLTHFRAAEIYFGVVGRHLHGRFEIIVGNAKIVFLHGHATQADKGVGVAGIQTVKFLVSLLCGGIVAKLEVGVCFEVKRGEGFRVEGQSNGEIGECVLQFVCLQVDVATKPVSLELKGVV